VRVSGLAFGLALAVRPAGLIKVSGVNGAPQARTRREFVRLAVVLAGAVADTAGTAAAGHWGRRARRKLPPRNDETPRVNPNRLRRVTLAPHSLSRLLASALVVSG
jgi:hypothetical protein